MQLKNLAKRLEIDKYPERLEEIYKSLDENDYSLCDTENIKQLMLDGKYIYGTAGIITDDITN